MGDNCKTPIPLILATAGCRSIRSLDEEDPALLLVPPGRRLDMLVDAKGYKRVLNHNNNKYGGPSELRIQSTMVVKYFDIQWAHHEVRIRPPRLLIVFSIAVPMILPLQWKRQVLNYQVKC